MPRRRAGHQEGSTRLPSVLASFSLSRHLCLVMVGRVRSLPYGPPDGTTGRQEVGMACAGGFFALADLLTPCGWLRPGHTGGSTHEAHLCAGALGLSALARFPLGLLCACSAGLLRLLNVRQPPRKLLMALMCLARFSRS